MARYLSQKRARPASWPAPFCVSACLRGVSTLQLRPFLLLSMNHLTKLVSSPPLPFLSLSEPVRPLSSLSLSSGIRLRAYARLCSGARVLCEFHSQLHETRVCCPAAPFTFSRMPRPTIFRRCPSPRSRHDSARNTRNP